MVTEGPAQWLSPSLPAPKGFSVSEGTGRYTTLKTPTPTPNNPDAELKPNMAVRCCKAILRKDFKKDPQINMIFEEICCRQDNDLLCNPPIGTSFDPQNISRSLWARNPTTGMLFCSGLPIFCFPNPFQTSMQLCHQIELVLMITTVLHSTLYLFWKARYGTYRVFVYPFYPGNYDDSEHILYIVGKVFSIGIQRR